MLTLLPSLMAGMTDEQLLRSLDAEPQIMRTPVELELMKRCERLVEERDERPTYEAVGAATDEAMAQYPEEGFLTKLADRIFDLGDKLRGDNKAEAQAIAQELSEIETNLVNAAAFGIEELKGIFE